ncbi:MAG: thiopurine S-methyltransferase [Gammaproteobacteria bacterium]
MEKDFWLKKWRNRDIGFHQQDVNPNLITHLNKLNLHLGNHILVPLCGKSRDMLWLADKKYQVKGVELSPVACQDFFTELKIDAQITKEKAFTKSKHQNIELYCGDLFELKPEDVQPVHAVYDCKALIALPSDMRKKYVKHLIACLGTQIKILLVALETSSEGKGPPFSVTEEEVHALYGDHFSIQKVKHSPFVSVPERLLKKGFTDLIETVYLISGT